MHRTILKAALFGLLFVGVGNVALAQPAAPPDAQVGITSADANSAEASIPTKNLLNVIRDGGVLMLPIGLCSFVLLVFVFERAISLRRGRVIPRPFVRRFLEQLREGQLDRDDALKLCEGNTPEHQASEIEMSGEGFLAADDVANEEGGGAE